MMTNLLFAGGLVLLVCGIGGYIVWVAGSLPRAKPGEKK